MQVVQIGDVTTGKKCWVGHFIRLTTLGTENENQITVMLYAANRFKKIVNADGFGIGLTKITH
jgi:hypothetical protein